MLLNKIIDIKWMKAIELMATIEEKFNESHVALEKCR